jgi:hypothetical protein
MLRLEKEVRKQLSQRVHDVVEEYLSDVQARPASSDFPLGQLATQQNPASAQRIPTVYL